MGCEGRSVDSFCSDLRWAWY